MSTHVSETAAVCYIDHPCMVALCCSHPYRHNAVSDAVGTLLTCALGQSSTHYSMLLGSSDAYRGGGGVELNLGWLHLLVFTRRWEI
jgi:hypothetical protein